jgi:hypothetical protein
LFIDVPDSNMPRMFLTPGADVMCLERIVRNFAFAVVAVVLAAGFTFTVKYQYLLNSLTQ